MAEYSRIVVTMARFLAIAHIIVGFLLIIFGVADGITSTMGGNFVFWTGSIFFGVWIGAWVCVTGGLGIPGSRYEISSSRNCFAGVFMGFSITSAVLAGIIIICYSMMLSTVTDYDYDYYDDHSYDNDSYRRWYSYDTKMALSVIVLILAIVEFVVGIWAAICLCVMKPCCGPAQGSIVTFAGIPGQTMGVSADGVQVAFPAQTAGGVVPVQASYMYAQGMPVGAVAGPPPPQLVVAASPDGADSPQETEMEAYSGKYMPLKEQP